MFTSINQILCANIDDTASNRLRRCDDDVVILSHLESIGALPCLPDIQDSFINRVGNSIIDQFAKDETVYDDVRQRWTEFDASFLPLHSSNSWKVSVGMGSLFPMCASPARL